MFRGFSIDPGHNGSSQLVWGSPTPNKPMAGPPKPTAPSLPASPSFLPPNYIKIQRNLVFSSWKTKAESGKEVPFTPHTSSKISPFHLHVATSKPPSQGKYLPPLAWAWPVGGGKNLVLNVTALRAQDMSWRQETPGSRARLCHGNSGRGLRRVSLGQSHGGRVLPLPPEAAGPSPARGVSLSHGLNSRLPPGAKKN